MITDTGAINSFGLPGHVSPSEQTITISLADLRQIIADAIQPLQDRLSDMEDKIGRLEEDNAALRLKLASLETLQDRVESLESTVASQGEEIAALRLKLASLETLQEEEITRVCVDIATDRRRLAALEQPTKEPASITARQADRIKILRALLAAHGGKMLTKEARQIMRMDKGAFSRLIDAMPEYVETKRYSLNKRQTVLILKSRLIVDDNDQRLK